MGSDGLTNPRIGHKTFAISSRWQPMVTDLVHLISSRRKETLPFWGTSFANIHKRHTINRIRNSDWPNCPFHHPLPSAFLLPLVISIRSHTNMELNELNCHILYVQPNISYELLQPFADLLLFGTQSIKCIYQFPWKAYCFAKGSHFTLRNSNLRPSFADSKRWSLSSTSYIRSTRWTFLNRSLGPRIGWGRGGTVHDLIPRDKEGKVVNWSIYRVPPLVAKVSAHLRPVELAREAWLYD